MELEKDIEKYLVKNIKTLGGLCLKFTSPGTRGVPDRIVLYQGRTFFVELKAPNKKPRPDQIKIHSVFGKQGFPVYVIDTKEGVNRFIAKIVQGLI